MNTGNLNKKRVKKSYLVLRNKNFETLTQKKKSKKRSREESKKKRTKL